MHPLSCFFSTFSSLILDLRDLVGYGIQFIRTLLMSRAQLADRFRIDEVFRGDSAFVAPKIISRLPAGYYRAVGNDRPVGAANAIEIALELFCGVPFRRNGRGENDNSTQERRVLIAARIFKGTIHFTSRNQISVETKKEGWFMVNPL